MTWWEWAIVVYFALDALALFWWTGRTRRSWPEQMQQIHDSPEQSDQRRRGAA